MNQSSRCSISSPVFGVVSVSDFGQFNKYVVVSQCCFNLYFPSDIWCTAPFHMLLYHLHIISCEVPVQVFCPFFNDWDVLLLLLSFKSFHIFLDESFIRYIFCRYILPVCSLPYSLDSDFHRSEGFRWSSAYQIFLSWIVPLVLYFKSHSHTQVT